MTDPQHITRYSLFRMNAEHIVQESFHIFVCQQFSFILQTMSQFTATEIDMCVAFFPFRYLMKLFLSQ